MAVKVNQKHEKEIVALNDFEAVRLRPDRHIGQTVAMEEKLQVIRDGKLFLADKIWSPGLNHLIVEILENAIDEAKRCKGRKMKNIWVSVNLDTNEVSIQDEGNGFYKAASKNGRTGKNIVRTAYEELNAGSNFRETENSILGTHGVGAAICNILSSHFEVVTVNSTHHIGYTWKDYEIVDEVKRKKQKGEQKGTRVSFIPSKDVFGNFNWDEEILKTYLSYKAFLISLDPNIKDLQINGSFIRNGKEEKIEVIKDFIPENHLSVNSKDGAIFLWKAYEDSCSLSFINGSKCTGIHQKIINDWLNNYFDYNLAHHFYETMIILNVPSSLMRFGDQNKTKYSVSRNEIEERIEKDFKSKLIRKLKKSQLSDDIDKEIEARRYNENIKKIKKSQRKSKRKISDKYSPASKRKKRLYITEGLSAAGSIKQARKSEYEGVYAIKGKIKNTKRLSDLTVNNEILEIMSVLGIDPSKKTSPIYEEIIIATDEDCVDEDTLIVTKNGDKKIKDLTYDDEVLTYDGTYEKIEKITETYKDEYVEININGETFYTSLYHRLIVQRDGEVKEVYAKDLKKTDFLLLQKQ